MVLAVLCASSAYSQALPAVADAPPACFGSQFAIYQTVSDIDLSLPSTYGTDHKVYVRNRDLAPSSSCTDALALSAAEEINTANNHADWAEIGWVEYSVVGGLKVWQLYWDGGLAGDPDADCTPSSLTLMSNSVWNRFRVRNGVINTTWQLDWDSGGGTFANQTSCDEGFSPGIAQGLTLGAGVYYGTGLRDHQIDLKQKYDSSHWSGWSYNRVNSNDTYYTYGWSYYRCSAIAYYIWNGSNQCGGGVD
jgi:hypothetical protein